MVQTALRVPAGSIVHHSSLIATFLALCSAPYGPMVQMGVYGQMCNMEWLIKRLLYHIHLVIIDTSSTLYVSLKFYIVHGSPKRLSFFAFQSLTVSHAPSASGFVPPIASFPVNKHKGKISVIRVYTII